MSNVNWLKAVQTECIYFPYLATPARHGFSATKAKHLSALAWQQRRTWQFIYLTSISLWSNKLIAGTNVSCLYIGLEMQPGGMLWHVVYLFTGYLPAGQARPSSRPAAAEEIMIAIACSITL